MRVRAVSTAAAQCWQRAHAEFSAFRSTALACAPWRKTCVPLARPWPEIGACTVRMPTLPSAARPPYAWCWLRSDLAQRLRAKQHPQTPRDNRQLAATSSTIKPCDLPLSSLTRSKTRSVRPVCSAQGSNYPRDGATAACVRRMPDWKMVRRHATSLHPMDQWQFRENAFWGDMILLVVIGLNILVFFLWQNQRLRRFMSDHFMISTLGITRDGKYHTFFTNMFSHEDLGHLLANMTVLWYSAPLLAPTPCPRVDASCRRVVRDALVPYLPALCQERMTLIIVFMWTAPT